MKLTLSQTAAILAFCNYAVAEPIVERDNTANAQVDGQGNTLQQGAASDDSNILQSNTNNGNVVINQGRAAYITQVVNAHATYCPTAIVVSEKHIVKTITAGGWHTITACPAGCTIVNKLNIPPLPTPVEHVVFETMAPAFSVATTTSGSSSIATPTSHYFSIAESTSHTSSNTKSTIPHSPTPKPTHVPSFHIPYYGNSTTSTTVLAVVKTSDVVPSETHVAPTSETSLVVFTYSTTLVVHYTSAAAEASSHAPVVAPFSNSTEASTHTPVSVPTVVPTSSSAVVSTPTKNNNRSATAKTPYTTYTPKIFEGSASCISACTVAALAAIAALAMAL
ncbi:c861826c-17f4-4de9-a77e-7bcb8f6c2197 [Sclerotinia trifoliorum]|uniref:C861826c-17f4-4de9-a77e-7bcb8f6c2197 n=1 Tax=Sclerotinia trifoliorum TaxID=28548 RepID=A0A8H2ZLU4_9HELO|nr:c861826c-17f4-4de9-a77e-7bcb8f6c2197 [Sclerotinia trifoliorum]